MSAPRFIDATSDSWHVAADGAAPAAHALLSLEQWSALRAAWPANLPVGVVVPNSANVESLQEDLPRWSLIALQFPKWTDGRAYSQARLLRARFHFAGEVRATGEVLVDMLPLLQRSGFDAVQLRADQDRATAEAALHFFAGHYQGDVATRPLFARQAA
jgi:uncharacterized protein (DUF934 family)